MSEVKQVTVGSVLCWILGLLIIVGALAKLPTDVPRAIVFLCSGLILLPPIGTWIASKTKYNLSGGIRFLISVGVLFVGNGLVYSFGGNVLPSVQDDTSRLIQETVQLPISSPVATKPPSPIFRIGDKVELGDYVLVVNTVTDCKSTNKFSLPDADKKFVIVDVTQENQGTDSMSANPLDFTLRDNQDFSYSHTNLDCKEPAFELGTLSNGHKQRGFITFEIIKENSPKQVVFTPSVWSSSQIIIDL